MALDRWHGDKWAANSSLPWFLKDSNGSIEAWMERGRQLRAGEWRPDTRDPTRRETASDRLAADAVRTRLAEIERDRGHAEPQQRAMSLAVIERST